MALNYKELKEIATSINAKAKSNHIANIVLINSTDIIFALSFYRKEKMLISLNHNYPFIGMINKEINFPTTLNKLCDELRKNVKDTIILSINTLNNDRIVEIALQKTDEFFEKHIFYLVIELIPHHPNILILDEERKIIFANHYSTLTDKRIILKGMKYELPENNVNKELSVNLDEYQNYVDNYLTNAMQLRLKEKYSKLIDTIKRKVKTANNKTKVLSEEIKEAETKLIYQEYGSTLLTVKDDKEYLEQYIKENNVPYDNSKSVIENANLFFKKYKKSKETIAHDKEQLEINNSLIDKLNNDLCSLNDADESIYLLLASKYLKTPIPKQEVNKLAPFYCLIDNTKIAFGRNAFQNDILTFKRAHKNNYFFHIKDYSGSHVVLLKINPNEKDMLYAAEVAIALSNKEVGEVQVALIKDIKKGQFVGQVIFNTYKIIRINKISDKVKVALNNVKRLNL